MYYLSNTVALILKNSSGAIMQAEISCTIFHDRCVLVVKYWLYLQCKWWSLLLLLGQKGWGHWLIFTSWSQYFDLLVEYPTCLLSQKVFFRRNKIIEDTTVMNLGTGGKPPLSYECCLLLFLHSWLSLSTVVLDCGLLRHIANATVMFFLQCVNVNLQTNSSHFIVSASLLFKCFCHFYFPDFDRVYMYWTVSVKLLCTLFPKLAPCYIFRLFLEIWT